MDLAAHVVRVVVVVVVVEGRSVGELVAASYGVSRKLALRARGPLTGSPVRRG
jgi:hypothetical protein